MTIEPRIDYLLKRLEEMNRLLDLRGPATAQEDETEDEKEKGGDKKRGGKGGSWLSTAVEEILFRRDKMVRPRIVGISHPSDGHPQEELTPDFAWFRPLASNNPTWTLYWPELII